MSIGRARAFAMFATTLGLAAFAQQSVPPPSALERELTAGRVAVKRIVVEGAKSISAADIRDIAAAYEGRALGEGDLRDIERRLSQLYLDRGYATSGVVLATRPGADGVAVFRAVEGTIDQVRFVQPPRYASARWLAGLLVPDPAATARLDDLQERMTSMREAGIVERINAELLPLAELGTSELRVGVEERRPWDVELRYDNYHPPAVGARRPSLIVVDRNVTGWGDSFAGRIGHTEGLHDARADYAFPLPRTGIRLGGHYERSDSLAIDPPAFRDLDITSLTTTAGGDVGYLWIDRPTLSLLSAAAYEKRTGESTLLGVPFSFIEGLLDGKSEESVGRLLAEVNASGPTHALFARVQWSEGRTNVPEGVSDNAPDHRFSHIAFQAQYARQLTERGVQALVRVDSQWTRDRLLPLEKKPLGGIETVRGYRENLILRDTAAAGTLELRSPLWRWEDRLRINAALFIDAGWGRSNGTRSDGLPASIASAGLTLACVLPWGFSARVDAALPNHRWLTDRRDSQDRGIHFQVAWRPTALLD